MGRIPERVIDEILELRVNEEQQSFVSPNAESLAQAYVG